jgi:predicted SAM-dependent methyltransferase
MKLNLGGGQQRIEGFNNVDLCPEADLKHDLRKPLPFPDKSVDELMAIHVIESFNQWEFPGILKDWARVLNGKMTIEFTDLKLAAEMYLNGEGEEKKWGHWGLYGNQENPVDPIILHHYVYEKEELEKLLIEAGFKNINFTKENIQHIPKRDWRVECFTT